MALPRIPRPRQPKSETQKRVAELNAQLDAFVAHTDAVINLARVHIEVVRNSREISD